ncbi:hypothetical protein [Borreliella turdi]|uniref:hypothetical protein n=1 Tax=Borreliella turdi TaxID=57863 RepID=UPI001243EFE8|nr:hypothetical protein [Borreliella turdi]
MGLLAIRGYLGKRFVEFVKKKVQLNNYVKKVLSMETGNINGCIGDRLINLNSQYQKSINREQYSSNEVPEKICMRVLKNNRDIKSNTTKDSLGFKSIKGVALESLGINKKNNFRLSGFRRQNESKIKEFGKIIIS